MKRFFIGLACLLLVFGAAQAQTAKSSAVKRIYSVDFSITMRDLFLAAKTQDDRSIPADKAILLDGDIGTITVHQDTDKNFIAEVELLNGTWVGEDQVDLYRTYVIFEGLQFRSWFSPQSQTKLKPGQTVLILASYEGIGQDYDEKTLVPIVKALDIRHIY
ncbi:MAG: hypothetical protein LDL24_11195 [Treponema sp.]|nr:hypothetical protein [Treponema sp.]